MLHNTSVSQYSDDSWVRNVRRWILFSPVVCDLSNLKKYRYNDGCFYIGSWKDGKRHGTGTYVDRSGEHICGEFRNDRIYNGEGVICYKDGHFFGSFVDGQKAGK